jgi:hypothetical protein
MTCVVRWNPGHWPYVTRCVLDHGHEDDHKDKDGYTLPNVPGQVEAEA